MPPRSFERLYTGPSIPVVYDPTWQGFTNLTQAQIAAFQSFPEAIKDYARYLRWTKEISELTLPNGMVLLMDDISQRKIAGLKQAFDNGALTGTIPFVAFNGVYQVTAADVTNIFNACVARVQATYAALAFVIAQIAATPQGITTRSQVDDLFGKIT